MPCAKTICSIMSRIQWTSLGTITSNLLEGNYQTKEQFAADCNLVIANCNMYYGNQADGQVYCDQASRIQELLTQQLTALERYDQSSQAKLLRSQPIWQTVHFPKPPVELLLTILQELRASQYTDRLTKVCDLDLCSFRRVNKCRLCVLLYEFLVIYSYRSRWHECLKSLWASTCIATICSTYEFLCVWSKSSARSVRVCT